MVYVVRRGDANSAEELVRGKARETTKCDRSPLKYPSKMKEFHDNPQSCRSFPCAVCLCVNWRTSKTDFKKHHQSVLHQMECIYLHVKCKSEDERN